MTSPRVQQARAGSWMGAFLRPWQMHPWVFPCTAVLTCLFVVLGVVFTEEVGAITQMLQSGISAIFGWYYTLLLAVLLPFVLWLAISRYGNTVLGEDHEKPAYTFFTWFSMLFSAGMGIGLLFYSIAEPVLHYHAPPMGAGGTQDAAELAMQITYFHWGLHAWSVYVIVGLSLAYFSFRHRLPLTIRSALYPILGERIHGGIGNAVDTIAVLGTLFGIATSLGLGAMQINAGLHHVFGLQQSLSVQLWIIVVITLMATMSAASGVNKGIRYLSELNVGLGVILLLFVLLLGPTAFILRNFVQSLGVYLQHLPETMLWTDAFKAGEWRSHWTVFYWGWWIAWSPFVGMFIAKISRGRTIRDFVIGVLGVPTLLTFIWFSVFGHTALHIELFGTADLGPAVHNNVAVALYALLEHFPWAPLTSTLATLVIITFFVTSADSGALVVDMITAGGVENSPVLQRIFWSLLAGTIAAVLLVAGGLTALQTGSIATSLPFSVVLICMCVGLVKALRAEAVIQHAPITPRAAYRASVFNVATPPK